MNHRFLNENRPLGLLVSLVLLCLHGCAGSGRVVEGEKSFATPAGEAGYHIMLAELAVQRDEIEVAAHSYRKAAMLSDDPEVAARASALAYESGSMDDALASAGRWLKLQPDSAQAHRYLLSIHLRRGETDAAARNLRWLLDEVAESRENGYVALTASLLDEPTPKAALETMKRVAKRDGEMAEASYAVGVLGLRAGDLPTALASARRAVDLKPDWSKGRLLLARALITDGKPDEGIAAAAELVESDPSAAVRLEYSVLLAAVGRDQEALLYLEALLAEQPDDLRTLRTAALMAMRAGDLDAAETYFKRLLGSGQRSYEALFYLASIAEERQDYPRAVRLFTQVLGGENIIAAQVRAARIIMQLGGVDRALDHLDRFAEEYPDYAVDMLVVQGELLNESGDPGRAVALYGEALQDNPGNESLLYARAFLLESLDYVEPAIEDLRSIVASKPDDAVALNALGYTLADRTDETREALRLIRRALELDPENPAVIDSMGWVQFRRGRLDEALEYLWRAYRLVQDSEIAAHIGEVLWTLGRQDEARDIFNKALSADPGNEVLEKVMTRLGIQ